MAKINQRIEIVSSTQPGLSSMGDESRRAIHAALSKIYSSVTITILNSLADLDLLVARKPDMVFLGMSFLPHDPTLGRHDTNRTWISTYLDNHEIAHTGSAEAAHMLERSKPLSKQRVNEAGLPTSAYLVVPVGNLPDQGGLPLKFPLFVKPADLGGGAGIDAASVVRTYAELKAKISSIHKRLHTSCLVEEYLPGREFSVAILKKEHMAGHHVMPIELIAPLNDQGARLLSAAVKSADAEQFQPVSSPLLKQSLSNLALDAFYALGARDYGRIDIRLNAAGEPQFLEANLIPSLIDGYGSFPKACRLNGISHASMLAHIVRLADLRSVTLPDIYPAGYQLAAV